jgi:MFS family permease
MVVTQALLVRRLVPRFGERRLIIAGTLLMAVGLLTQAETSGLPLLLGAVCLTAVGNGCNNPSLSSLISRAAAGEQQGSVLGVAQALGALARVVGPLVGNSTLAFGTAVPYVIGGVTMLIACAFAAIFVKQPSA